jgi:hypothetical protein
MMPSDGARVKDRWSCDAERVDAATTGQAMIGVMRMRARDAARQSPIAASRCRVAAIVPSSDAGALRPAER